MNHCAKHILGVGWLACLLLVLSVTSCTDLIFDSREGCERGVYVNFKYDYNLYRADMFADHVGEVTLYVSMNKETILHSVQKLMKREMNR